MAAIYNKKNLEIIEMQDNNIQIRYMGNIYLLGFEDEKRKDAFLKTISLIDGKNDIETIKKQIDLPAEEFYMMFDNLIESDLLEPSGKDYLEKLPKDYIEQFGDVFQIFNLYTIDSSRAERIYKIYSFNITIIGANALTREIVLKLLDYGFINISIFRVGDDVEYCGLDDLPGFAVWKNTSITVKTVPSVDDITSSDLGDFTIAPLIGCDKNYFDTINDVCVKNKKNWIPLYYKDAKGIIGPAVISGKTACLGCLELKIIAGDQDSWLSGAYPKDTSELFPDEVVSPQSHLQLIANNFIIDFLKLCARHQYAICYNNIMEVACSDCTVTLSRVNKYAYCSVCNTLKKKLPYDVYAYAALMSKK